MNDRIKELYKEAYGVSLPVDNFVLHSDDQQFAKLLIQECLSLFDGSTEMKTVGMLTHGQIVKRIQDHFGVEE